MIILTCASSEFRRWEDTEIKDFSYRSVIQATARRADACGYRSLIFDLGTLGLGERYEVQDAFFAARGYYEKEAVPGYRSKSLFKPELVQMVMSRHEDVVAYLDGDAQLVGCIDDIVGSDYDVGVTLRPRWETESDWHRKHIDVVKFINAGVIFFNPTEGARQFVEDWRRLTGEVGNDQMALNQLACPDDYPDAFSVKMMGGVRIKYFPCERYNFYFFGDLPTAGARILHFKGNVRRFYPFSWEKRLYCRARVALRNLLS